MLVSRFVWAGPVLGILFGLGLLALGEKAAAQEGEPPPTYIGSDVCGLCHETQYEEWYGHGHGWFQLHTAGRPPEEWGLYPGTEQVAAFFDKYPDIHIPVIDDYAGGSIDWDDVQDIMGHFKDGEGYLLLTTGQRATTGSTSLSTMPANCNQCHNTGFTYPPSPDDPPHEDHAAGHAYFAETNGESRIQGGWALNGIHCERCHGMGSEHGLMGLPKDEVRSGLDSCRDCHSSGRPDFQISYSVTNDIFDRHHGEGDEYRRSPHKNLGCTACHDPHKSIWKKEGGLKGIDEHDAVALGNMCVRCHNGRPLANGIVLRAMKLRGAHGEMGLLCMDCHMQENSAGGHRRTHLWKVNTAPLAADDNVSGVYWKNEDGTLGWSLEPGVAEASLTLDLVCTRCHENRDVATLSSGAKYIHRQPGLVDLTVNGGDNLQIVKKTTPVSVEFAVYPEELGAGPAPAADWYVLQQKPRGWSYWNGTKWRGGLKPWRKNTPVADITQNVLNAPLKKPGNYTFWMLLDIPTGEELGDSVPVYVSKR